MSSKPRRPFWLIPPLQWEHTIEARFDDPADYGNGKREGMMYVPKQAGDDLKVRAAQRGKVITVRDYPQGYGLFVKIEHTWGSEKYVSWYGHLKSASVSVGEWVKVGDTIGIAGDSGTADKVCLFLTLQMIGKGKSGYVVNNVVDPEPYFITERTTRFWLKSPIEWGHTLEARFNDPADYGNGKREGVMYVPDQVDGTLDVLAPHKGTVSAVNTYKRGYGLYVTIDHLWGSQTFVSWYGHLKSANVRVGETVDVGDVIGVAGDSGTADKVCLFFTLQLLGAGNKGYVVDDVVDPALYLTQEPPKTDDAAADQPQEPPKTDDAAADQPQEPPKTDDAAAGQPQEPPKTDDAAAGQPQEPQVPVHNEMGFEADVTLPDGEIVACGTTVKKIWRLRNTGTTSWGAGYEFVQQESGEPMGTVDTIPLPAANPDDTVQVSVEIAVPETPGVYRSTWQPRTPDGRYFDHEQWVEIDARAEVDEDKKPLLRFVSETIPDGTRMAPGDTFRKTWGVRNSGNTVWKGYTLRPVGDRKMGEADSVPLPELEPWKVGNVTVDLVAPDASGTHRSTWYPHDENGNRFEYDLYAEITVQKPQTLNTLSMFDSPVSGSWTKGTYRYLTKVPYGDGLHNGIDYINCNGHNLSAGGEGIVYKVYRCTPCQNKSFVELRMSQEEMNRAYSDIRYVFGFGNLVIIRHEWASLPARARAAMKARGFEGYYAFVYYAHMRDMIHVSEGQAVVRGTSLGYVGNTGNSTTPHLHLEIRCYNKADPWPLEAKVHHTLIDPEEMFEF